MKYILFINFFRVCLVWISVGERVMCRDAPVVSPFIFPPALKEGERGSAICTIRVRRPTRDKDIASNDPSDSIQMSPSGSLIIQKVEAAMKGPL
ncbi:hypothetical protein CEXT_317421 [Caerostris extrusa]|uniref:Secreted protein n=1 Tax=Caerostris extrusa TaxID=172846 RepID=A0AAV4XZW8_CAEEX|nr:hypothetical protein CEXT_317421 [Caerostris extrusa]